VVEREGQIIACAALFPFFEEKCGEVAAIAVSPDCRGQGQGDKLLGKKLLLTIWLQHYLLFHIFDCDLQVDFSYMPWVLIT